jgi:chromosome partitioning protein
MVVEARDELDEQPSQFGDIFAKPAIEHMYDLGDKRFEAFVHYVFECAGCTVEYVGDQHIPHGPGVDLNLYAGHIGGKPLARVEVRCYKPGNLLDNDSVMAFIGKLHMAQGAPGYMVTTSDFTSTAYKTAVATHGRVTLINGERLQRYIAYVRGSRLTGASAPVAKAFQLPPLSPTCLIDADTISRFDPRATTVVAVANNRGGVAKTTTVVDVAFTLAEQHQQRVLLVDMDGQASMTAALPPPGPKPPAAPPPDGAYLSAFFAGRKTLPSLLRPTRFPNVWLVPSHEHLLLLDSGGAGRPDDELRFVRALHDPQLVAPDGKPFDWILLDTPPAQSFYTRAALASSHYMLIPVNAETFAAIGASRALKTASTMRALIRGAAEVVGILITDWRQSAEAGRALSVVKDLAAVEQTRVFNAKISHDDRVLKGHSRTAGGWLNNLLQLGAVPGPAAKDYDAFVKEMLLHVHRS